MDSTPLDPHDEATAALDSAMWSPIPGIVIEGELGRGGMGVVYRARQKFLDRPVALKLLDREKFAATNSIDTTRFIREARILASLHHPHIAACHEAGVTAAGVPYLLMELVDGPSLSRWLADHGPLPTAHALLVTQDLSAALAHAQERGIIHRDVKPDNVLLAQRSTSEQRLEAPFPWTVKLVDLGIARPSGPNLGVTQPGLIIGTPTTMAPEQFQHPDRIDWRVDLYGLGCVLYHTLTGQAAFSGSNLMELVHAKVSAAAPDPCRINPVIPPGVSQLVMDLLAADPAQRPPSYAAVIARCQQLLSERTTLQITPVVPHRAPSRHWLILGMASAVAVVALGSYLMIGARHADPSAHVPATMAEIPKAIPVPVPVSVSAAVTSDVTTSPGLTRPAAMNEVPIDLLAEIFAGMPGWDMSRGEAAPDEETGALILGRGVISHPLERRATRITIELAHPGKGIVPGTTTLTIRLADGSESGVIITDLGGQLLAQAKTADSIDHPPSSAPLVLPAADHWRIELVTTADHLWVDLEGREFLNTHLSAVPLRLQLAHQPAEGGIPSAVALRRISMQ